MKLFYGLCELGMTGYDQEQRGVLEPPEHPPLPTPLNNYKEICDILKCFHDIVLHYSVCFK